MSKTCVLTYEDLVGQHVNVRLYDKSHPEWQKCKVVEVVQSVLKVQSTRNAELFVIDKNDVVEDIRAAGVFVPWKHEQEPYDGTFLQTLKLFYDQFTLIHSQ